MRPPDNPGRTLGAHTRLVTVTYADIAQWTGLSHSTVRQYASRGLFDPRDIHSVLQWVNTRRARQGKIAIGHPDHDPPQTTDATVQNSNTPHSGGYNPLTGEYS